MQAWRNEIYYLMSKINKMLLSTAKTLAGCTVNNRVILVTPPVPATLSNAKYGTKKEGSFDLVPYKLHKLDKGPATSITLTAEDALHYYEKMTYLRRMEIAASNLYKNKKVRGFCHLYTGQEAVGTGIWAAMRKHDTVITSYRCHGWVYLMGDTVLSVLAELTGRESGNVRGKGGSMHMYTKKFFGGNGIVGAQTPLGTGVAFAHKYLGDGGVTFTLYGDGAANQGQLHEVFNLASLWKLPVCFVCENNIYGMGTRINRSSASTEYYKRGDYIPGLWVDGMDILSAREATRYIIDYCTSGKGPIVCEMETYRYFGHSMSDPGTSYRTREEVQKVRQTRDPINNFKEKILNSNLVTADELKKIDDKAKKDVDAATKHAASLPVVGVEEVAADVYYHNLHHEIRGTTPITPYKHIEKAPRKSY